MAELQFWLLGQFQAWRGDARIDTVLSGRLARELLAYLLLERDRGVPAERLMDLFWPRLEPRAAANNLQGVVLKLRRWLEPDLRRGRDSRYLLTEADGYLFPTDDCSLDTDEFSQAVQAGRAARRRDDLPTARAALERALRLYRGELLSDMPYAEWAYPARERLRELHLQALEALGEACLRLGDCAETLTVCRQAQAIDNLREAFVLQQMRASAALGQRAEALAAYEAYEALLNEELGVQPSAQAQALREAILAGTLPPLAAGPATAPAVSVELPLVGRAGVLKRLQHAWRDQGGLVLLSGQAGLGKTRLLAEFGATAPAGQGAAVYWSHARANDPPFAAVLRFVEAYLGREPSASRLAGLGPLGAPLAQRLPALRQRWPGCPPYTALPAPAEQERLHQAALAALRLAASGPAAFLLDDLQWVDEDSLTVLVDILHEPQAGVLVVGAFRGEEARDGVPVGEWLAARCAGVGRRMEIELSPLESADVLAVVRAVAGLADPLPFSQRLHAVTGGHPLFLAEMLRGLLDAGMVYRDAGGAWHGAVAGELDDLPLTPTLREAVLERAGRLDQIERQVLDAAAVLRPRRAAPILLPVLQIEAGQLEAALQNLTARGWLTPAGPDRWEFGHYLTAEVIYGELAASHRSLLHRLAAGALMAATPTTPSAAAAEIVTHLQEGAGPTQALIQWAVLAGQWAQEQFAYRQAHAYFELGEMQLGQWPDSEEKRRLALAIYEGLGTVRPLVGQSQAAVDSLRQALPFAAHPADRARVLLLLAGTYEYDAAEYEQARSFLSQAEALLLQAGSADREALCRLHTIQARIHYWRGEYRQGERLARQAVEEGRQTPAEPGALNVLALNLIKLGSTDEAIGLYRQLLEIAQARGHLRGVAVSQINLGLSFQVVGQLTAALEAYDQAHQALEQLGDLRSQSIAQANLGNVSIYLGRLERAEVAFRRAIELAQAVGAPYTVALARHLLGQALTLRGRLKEAGAELEAALAQARAINAQVVEAQARLNHGLWHWARGEAEAAKAQAARTLAAGDALGDNFCQRESRLLLGMAALAEGNRQAAEAYAREAHRIASDAQQVLAVGRAERLLGLVATARREIQAAEGNWAASEEIFRRCGAPIELGQTLLARAEAARAHGQPAAAWRPWLVEARRLFRRSKAQPLLKQSDALLSLS